MKCRFLINNKIDNATLTTNSNIVSTLPIDNVKETSRSRVVRSINTTSAMSIYGTFPDVKKTTGFIIGNHNFTEGVSYELILYYSPDWSGSPIPYANDGSRTVTAEESAVNTDEFLYNLPIWVYDENNPDVILYPGSFTLNITVGSSSNMDFFQFGRIFMGEAIETAVGVSLGHSIYWKETTNQFRTEDGTLRSDIITPSKVLAFSLDTINDSDRQNLQRSFAQVGMREDFFVSLFPGSCTSNKELDYSGIVKLTKIPKYSEFAQNFYKSKYVVEEI